VLRPGPLDVANEVSGAVRLLAAQAEQAGVLLRSEVAPDLPPLRADPTRLRQILLNLLSNAVKFTGRGGRVTITAVRARQAEEIVFQVEDTGIGILAEDLPRILRPFAQAMDAGTESTAGTGLGLPLAKGLTELHGGSFKITSAPGVGTRVTIRLPLAREAVAAPPAARAR
jgi:signal transduction histidine kinase